jgi:hypothetical protein
MTMIMFLCFLVFFLKSSVARRHLLVSFCPSILFVYEFTDQLVVLQRVTYLVRYSIQNINVFTSAIADSLFMVVLAFW